MRRPALLLVLAVGAAGAVVAAVPEPDHVIYGTPLVAGVPATSGLVTVSVGDDPVVVASCAIGSNPAWGEHFVLWLPVSTALPAPPGAATPGAEAHVFVNGEPLGDTVVGGPGTVQDLDAVIAGTPPEVAIHEGWATEGSAGAVAALFPLDLSKAHAEEVSVGWATVGGSATPWTDFEPGAGRAVFAPGEVEAEVEVAVVGDALDELDETFRVVLSDPANATLAEGGAEAVGTIVDDDPMARLTAADVEVMESCLAGSEPVAVGLLLDGPSGLPVEVSYATSNGTAVAPADYQMRFGRVDLAPGEVAATVEVVVHSDGVPEEMEVFFLNLTSAVNAVLDTTSVRVTIWDDQAGDANGDCAYDAADVAELLKAMTLPYLPPGDPDCNRSGGAPDVDDLVCLLGMIYR